MTRTVNKLKLRSKTGKIDLVDFKTTKVAHRAFGTHHLLSRKNKSKKDLR